VSSKKGKVIQSALGSVNDLDVNHLDQADQANSENLGTNKKIPKQDTDSDENQSFIYDGLGG
jgi:hypothetical protein